MARDVNPLRLAFVGNPASVLFQRWVNFFADRGHEVVVLDGFGTPDAPGLDPRVRLIRYDAWGARGLPVLPMLRARSRLRRILRDLQPDVLHAHSAHRYGWQAGLSGTRPYVISVWGSDVLLNRPTWQGRFWTRYALSRADLVTAVSGYMRDAAVRRGADPRRVVEIQHGVDTRRFFPRRPPFFELRLLGLEHGGFVFSPRAIAPIYNHETIVAAFADLIGDHELLMTDRGADPEYLAEIQRRAGALGVGDRVRIIEAPPDDLMPSLYQAAGVVVSAPRSDSFPVTLHEAMACGTPIVAGDLPPIRAVLADLAPGAIVPTEGVEPMAAAIRVALDLTTEERVRLGERLRRYVVETADYETNMLRMEDIYRDLAHRGR